MDELRKFRITCDRCGIREEIEGTCADVSSGWIKKLVECKSGTRRVYTYHLEEHCFCCKSIALPKDD